MKKLRILTAHSSLIAALEFFSPLRLEIALILKRQLQFCFNRASNMFSLEFAES